MGQSGSHINRRAEQEAFLSKLYKRKAGQKISSCNYEKWINGGSAMYGFNDAADYVTKREDKGVLLWPDTTEGRYLRVEKHSDNEILLTEKRPGEESKKLRVQIPACFSSGNVVPSILITFDDRRLILDYIHNLKTKDGVLVIGCHGNLAVIQFLNRQEHFLPEFYFVDLKERKCLGKFSYKDAELLWYECFISPDHTRILLRPDGNTNTWTVSDNMKTHTLPSLPGTQIMTMRKFADSSGHALTFDNRHGNRYLFRAKVKTVQLFDLETMETVKSVQIQALSAPVRQIKASPSGHFLVR